LRALEIRGRSEHLGIHRRIDRLTKPVQLVPGTANFVNQSSKEIPASSDLPSQVVKTGRPPTDPENRPQPATWRRALLLLATGLALLVATCVALSWTLPERRLPQITNKMTFLRSQGPTLDTLFIGSSRFYHGISPKVFDADMAAAGRVTRSFNLGVDDMKPPESLETLERVLREHRVRCVFLELCRLQIDPRPLDQTTERDVAWHRWKWTEAVLREVPGGRRKGLYSGHSGTLFHIHLRLWLENFFNLGRARVWTAPAEPLSQRTFDLGPDGDGYIPRPAVPWKEAAKFTSLVEQIQRGEAELEWTRDPQFLLLLSEISAECHRHETQLILVIPPTLTSMPRPPEDIPTLAFNDPRKYPKLFSAAQHSDWEHLAQEGATEFSRALAEEYLVMTDSKR
jgi:hypothetical protein